MGNLTKGYIQIYTGNGKGKTTAAVGLATRAAGNKYRVCMVQFLKSDATGELQSAKLMAPYFTIHRFERPRDFFWNLNDEEKVELKKDIQVAYEFCLKQLKEKSCDILIMDEIMGTLTNKLITEEQLLQLLDLKPDDVEIVMTGRDVPEKIMERANLVTEMKDLKHYFEEGVPARRGIEF
ncbi:MAG: cob(I)yrinic acid a,c-diamide adenosyltransferase [Clostridium sp.]|uniref:cob(I)yrinic acid a,c-diamide adenosyltransferase n=1 Tax=Clostridium culturomicium TaxID=1499683 RepID=UPI0005911CDA|nr:cob(I)yrinic acid a,c-diamide adenosyltransferase [Clostridium culturomicium]MDU4892061.1 cob(I)yrinic acid a,c-diamide adenosyltransferase [Clostridium sp.]MDU7082448.1 cob(I)yrinic acid a,c-diamide adenosyltransferase [Clostridium sp.]